MTYSKDQSDDLGQMIFTSRSKLIDAANAPPDVKIKALQSLVTTLESAVSIALGRHYADVPEPFPGACKEVLRQSLQIVDLARRSKLLPEKKTP